MPSNKIVLGLVGEIGAGKGAAAKYLETRYGAVTYRFSTPMRDCVRRLHLPETRDNLQTFSTVIRKTFGEDVFSKTIALDAAEAAAPVIIAEGIRRPDDIVELAKLPSFHLIAITADERTRFERVKLRNENASDAEKTWEDFRKEGKAEAETRIRDIAAKAEFSIDNNGTLEELYRQLDAAIAKARS